MQEEIDPIELVEAHEFMTEFSNRFEELYVQHRYIAVKRFLPLGFPVQTSTDR
jgi:hypothetical protein